jgi:hypothetical protein
LRISLAQAAIALGVKSVKRESGYSFDDGTFQFVVELRCRECASSPISLLKRFAGALSNIKKLRIRLNGIEVERI